MSLKHTRSVLGSAAIVAVAAVTLSGCGDTVTANRNWYSQAAINSVVVNPTGSGPLSVERFNGLLTTSQTGQPEAGTRVSEQCVRPAAGHAAQPWSCVLLLNTGHKDYIATGTSLNLFSSSYTLKTLTNPQARIIVTPLGATSRTADLRIATRL